MALVWQKPKVLSEYLPLLTIDDHVTWPPAVTETLALCRRLLSTL